MELRHSRWVMSPCPVKELKCLGSCLASEGMMEREVDRRAAGVM